MDELVIRQDRDGAATLVLNRPEKLNALNVDLFRALEEQVARLEQESDSVGLVIVRGAGRCFSAGHDLGDIAAGEKPPEPFYQSKVIERLANLPQPVISAVHGHCYTGALELALAGDIVFAAEGAKLADTHAKWALTPVWGMSQRLPRRVGTATAKRLMFTADMIDAAEAVRIGLVEYAVPAESFGAEVQALATRIVANSAFSHAANKRLLDATDSRPLDAGLQWEVLESEGVGPDARERIAAFTRKRG
jgi:enoyl-CoA hydratase/carnithine racemase